MIAHESHSFCAIMSERAQITTETLERYREYLSILARGWIGSELRPRVPPSDIVQQTLFDAHRKRAQFRGSTQAQVSAWLRRILASRLTDAFRASKREKRDVARERSLNEAIDESHTRLENCLAAVESSAGAKVRRSEQLVLLSRALAELRNTQRQAIELKFLHGLSVHETADEMRKTPAAVGGLLRRGLARLRELLSEEIG